MPFHKARSTLDTALKVVFIVVHEKKQTLDLSQNNISMHNIKIVFLTLNPTEDQTMFY